MSTQSSESDRLAIYGGTPAKQRPDPPMYPGGMMIDQEEEQAVLEVLRSKRLFRYYGPEEGPSKVYELEQAFAAHAGSRRALAVTSGTAALICGLQGIGIGPGDEVIIPAYTWIASAAAVLAVGGVPILAEVDESLTLDPADVETKITPYTKAIMPVHMRGAPCRMDAVMDIARRHGLRVIEDTAQADGGSYKGQALGSIGDVGCFSLQFNKIITAGEGGMVITDDEEVWKRAIMFHDVVGGLRSNFPADEIVWGINFRMPELLAAVMLVQLRRLDGLLTSMRERKRMLRAGIEEVARRKGVTFREITDPEGDAAVALVFFTSSPVVAGRVSEALRAENIGADVLYHPDRSDYHVYAHWTPIINQRTWTQGGGPWRWAQRDIRYSLDMCPRTLDLLGRAVHLDVSPLFTNEDVEETIEGLNRVLNALA
ncbi:MAG: DegT/DnrJ/EryC1/StrS family aminotransferase [Candidatus Hodarchaeota archaeon]